MRCFIEDEDGVSADCRGEDRVCLAGMEHLWIASEDLPNGFGIRKHHELAVPGNVECEGVTVATAALIKQRERIT
jgi:hypothetical protein